MYNCIYNGLYRRNHSGEQYVAMSSKILSNGSSWGRSLRRHRISHKYECSSFLGVPHRSSFDRFTCAQRDSTVCAPVLGRTKLMESSTRKQTVVPSPAVSHDRSAGPDVLPYQRYQCPATTVGNGHKEGFSGFSAYAPEDPLAWVQSAAVRSSLGEQSLINFDRAVWTAYHEWVTEQ
ncbi:hypothetical protein M513_01561 [Trichuris suis]|uniref:Uncharacterized protein n=1 Tax=Trichuris suis TaxID=68888 RepID=A0A085MJR2_9BILA|nr:hypothetical protein M513_01561 [Trichuris suis]